MSVPLRLLSNDHTYTCPARWFDKAHREILEQSPYAPNGKQAKAETQHIRDLIAVSIGWAFGVAMTTLAICLGWLKA